MSWTTFVDNVNATLASNNLVVITDLFYASSYFHESTPFSYYDTLCDLLLGRKVLVQLSPRRQVLV